MPFQLFHLRTKRDSLFERYSVQNTGWQTKTRNKVTTVIILFAHWWKYNLLGTWKLQVTFFAVWHHLHCHKKCWNWWQACCIPHSAWQHDNMTKDTASSVMVVKFALILDVLVYNSSRRYGLILQAKRQSHTLSNGNKSGKHWGHSLFRMVLSPDSKDSWEV
jgi:hypothetical protein